VTAGLGYGFDSYAVNIYGLVLPDIKKTLHITDAEAGYIGSIFLLGYTIGTIGFGFAADRWGRKATLGASILLYGITTSLAGLTANVAAFTGLRFLTGVGGAAELAVGAPYTAEVWPTKTRALGVGGVIFSLSLSLGYVLAAAVALALVPHFGWQSAFIVAIVPAIVLFLVRRGIRESHRYTDVQTKSTTGQPSHGCGTCRASSATHLRLAHLHRQRRWLLGRDRLFDDVHREEVPRILDRRDPLRTRVLPASGRLRLSWDRARGLGGPAPLGDPRRSDRVRLNHPGGHLPLVGQIPILRCDRHCDPQLALGRR